MTAVTTPGTRTRDVRLAAGALIGAAAAWPLLPVHPPLACPLRTLTGVPCPLCGITRAVVAAVQGRIVDSLAYNPAGIVLVLIGIAYVFRPALARRIRPPTWALGASLGALWLWNVGFNPTFGQWLLPG
jgi:hypothetical protein